MLDGAGSDSICGMMDMSSNRINVSEKAYLTLSKETVPFSPCMSRE